MRIREIFNKISSIGLKDQMEFLESTKIRTLNQQAFFMSIMCAFFAIEAIGHIDMLFIVAAMLFTFYILYLNSKNRWEFAAFLWIIIYPILVVVCAYFYGDALRVDYIFIYFILSVLFFFHHSKLKFFALALILGFYLVTLYIFHSIEAPYGHNVFWYDKIIMFGVTVLCTSNIIMVLLRGFHRYYEKNEEKRIAMEALNEELTQKAESLEKINVHLQRQVHLASHDLKTPLRTISGFTSLLKKESFKQNGSIDEGKLEEYHQHVQQGVSTMNQIIEEYIENSIEGVRKG